MNTTNTNKPSTGTAPQPDEKGTKGENSVVVDTTKKQEEDTAHRLTIKEEETFAADLEPGEAGFLPIDEKGKATGPATSKRPESGLYADVVCKGVFKPAILMTPAGAPIMEPINPSPASLKESERRNRDERNAKSAATADNSADANKSIDELAKIAKSGTK